MEDCIPKLNFHLPFLYKYVADIITAISDSKTDEVLATFNSYNQHLQFAVERGENFLDTKVIQTAGNKIILNSYIHELPWLPQFGNKNQTGVGIKEYQY